MLTPGELQVELIDLQSHSDPNMKFPVVSLFTFYHKCVEKVVGRGDVILRAHAARIFSFLGVCDLCEQILS